MVLLLILDRVEIVKKGFLILRIGLEASSYAKGKGKLSK